MLVIRGQVSLEFMVFFGLLLLITVVTSGIALTSTNQINEESTGRDAKRLLQLTATEINIAYEIGDGFSHNFYLNPVLRDGSDYNITVTNQTVYIFWRGRTYLIPVLTHNITHNNLTDGFTLDKGNNFIRNTGGVVQIA